MRGIDLSVETETRITVRAVLIDQNTGQRHTTADIWGCLVGKVDTSQDIGAEPPTSRQE